MSEPPIDRDSIVSWSAKAVAADVNDEVVLLNLDRDRCYGLGTTGSAIWRRLAAPIRVSDVASQLIQEYDAPAETIEADLIRTLTRLQEEGLLLVHADGRSD